MILKMPLSKCIVINISELDKELVLQNNAFKICTGCVDQYVVTENNQLYGIISSPDIERKIKANDDFDIYSVINKQPITIIQGKFERDQVDNIFQKTFSIHSIPIVNRMGELLYVYIKVGIRLKKFVKQNFLSNVTQYQQNIKQEILDIKRHYPNANVRIISDFEKYGIELEGIEEYCIRDDEINFLEPEKDFVHLVYLYDFNCMKVIQHLIENRIKFSGSNFMKKDIIDKVVPYFKIDESAKNVLEEEAYYNADYFDLNDFQNIFQAIHLTEDLNGCYVEIGTYRGDSARAALSYMKKNGISKKAYFLDTYEGFFYSEAEISSDYTWAYSHNDTSIDFVKRRLCEFSNYELIKTNIITEELPEDIQDIAVCNIDVDMYEAVESALKKVYKKILPGGIIIAEDFGHTPALFGAQYAVSKFMSLHKDIFYGIYLQSGQYLMIKKQIP